MIRLSVVVPCYNEQEGLAEFYRRIRESCVKALESNFEIIFINDGSTDNTLPALLQFAAHDPNVVVVNLSRNHGHQLALSAGLSLARGELVFILDADLQDPPELLEPMLKSIEQGADVVYGQRRDRAGESVFKKLTAKAFYRLISQLSSVEIPLDTGDFRLMRRRVVDVLNSMPEQHRFIRGMVSWAGFRQVPYLYDRDERYAGETKYPLRKMITFALDALTGFSIIPLRLSSWIGLSGVVVAVFLVFYSLASFFSDRVVAGWTSILSVVLFIGSVQLVMLGLLGEYIGRIFMQSKQRPLFVIESITGGPLVDTKPPAL